MRRWKTGKGADAPDKRRQLLAAMQHARKQKAVLLVSRLDRLSRNMHFISGLMEKKSQVRFTVAELGEEVDTFQLHIHATVAEKERELISQRTKEALDRRRAAGKWLGHPQFTTKINKMGNERMRQLAIEFAHKTFPHIKPHLDEGKSYCQIAKQLQKDGIPTARGGDWEATQVAAIVKRVQPPNRSARA